MKRKIRKMLAVLTMMAVMAGTFINTGNTYAEAKAKTEKRTKSDYSKKRKATKEEKKLFKNPDKIESVKGFADDIVLVFVDAGKYKAGTLKYAGYALKEEGCIHSKNSQRENRYAAFDAGFMQVLNLIPKSLTKIRKAIYGYVLRGVTASDETKVKATVVCNIEGTGKNGYSESTPEIKGVKYTSSDKKIFTVAKDGTITPKNPGIATLTAAINGKKLTTYVSVSSDKELTVPLTDKGVCSRIGGVSVEQDDIPQLVVDRSMEYRCPALRRINIVNPYDRACEKWLYIEVDGRCDGYYYTRSDKIPGYSEYTKEMAIEEGLEYKREKDKAITIIYNGMEHLMDHGVSYATLYKEGLIEYPCRKKVYTYIDPQSVGDNSMYKALQQLLDRWGLTREVLLGVSIEDARDLISDFIGKYATYKLPGNYTGYCGTHTTIAKLLYFGEGVCADLSPFVAYLWRLTGRDSVLVHEDRDVGPDHLSVSLYQEDDDTYHLSDSLWGIASNNGFRDEEEDEFAKAVMTDAFIEGSIRYAN